jgi:probable phosphoglycerate mutase
MRPAGEYLPGGAGHDLPAAAADLPGGGSLTGRPVGVGQRGPDVGELLTGTPARRVQPRQPPEESDAPPGAQVLVIRHGQSEWNALGRGHGWGDPPLSPLGEQQARDAVAALASQHLDPGVLASDLARATRTAELVAAPLGLGPVRTTADLREHDIGDWDGRTWDEIEATWPGVKAAWVAEEIETPPGGESRAAFHRRVDQAVRAAVAAGLRRRQLIVAHGGVVRALERLAGIDPTPIEFLSGRWFSIQDGQLRAGDRFWATRPAGVDF